MQGVLEAYGFGPKCKNWFKLLCKNLKAYIQVNGFITESIRGPLPTLRGHTLLLPTVVLLQTVFSHYTSARRRYAP